MTKTVIAAAPPGLVLAVHVSTFGFGWVLFETPRRVVSWALVRERAGHDAKLLQSFKRLIERYEPAVLAVEAFEDGESRRRPRIQKLYRAMIGEANAAQIGTRVFDRDVIRAAFVHFGAQTRGEIARVIADRIDSFGHRLPGNREVWNTLDPRQSLFDAAAIAVTYFVAMGELDPWD